MSKIELPNAARHSIHKGLEKPAKGQVFTPGEHPFEGRVVLDVATVVKKGEPSEYVPTVKIPWMRVMVLGLKVMGFQRNEIAKKIVESADLLMNMAPEDAEAFDMEGTEAEKMFNDMVRSKLSKATRQGATTWKGSVEVVGIEVAK